jgi:hypothetical protein
MPLTKIYHAAKQHDGGRASDHLHINLKSHFQRILRCILFYCRLRKLNNHQHLHFHSTSTLSLNIFTFTQHLHFHSTSSLSLCIQRWMSCAPRIQRGMHCLSSKRTEPQLWRVHGVSCDGLRGLPLRSLKHLKKPTSAAADTHQV